MLAVKLFVILQLPTLHPYFFAIYEERKPKRKPTPFKTAVAYRSPSSPP